jgi:hypothetical protein
VFVFGSIVLTRFPFTDLLALSADRPWWSRGPMSAEAPDRMPYHLDAPRGARHDVACRHSWDGPERSIGSALRQARDTRSGCYRRQNRGAPASHRTTFFGVFGFGQP